jgi:hypothetical protein
MRKRMWIVPALFLLATLGTSAVANADDITYNYDISNGPITLTGTIVTDGTLGSINPCNSFIAGTATIDDSTHSIISTLASPNVLCSQTGTTAWFATATSIYFNFNASVSSTEFSSSTSGVPILVFTSNPDPGEIEVTDSNGQTNAEPRSGFIMVATAPEPGSGLFLATGIGLFGLIGLKRRRAKP